MRIRVAHIYSNGCNPITKVAVPLFDLQRTDGYTWAGMHLQCLSRHDLFHFSHVRFLVQVARYAGPEGQKKQRHG